MSLLCTMAISKDNNSRSTNYSRVNVIHNSHLATVNELRDSINGPVREITTQAKYDYTEVDLNLYPSSRRALVYKATMQEVIQLQGEAIEKALDKSDQECGAFTYMKNASVGYENPETSENDFYVEGVSHVHAIVTLTTNCPTN